jgi:hypothetical protein
MADDQATLGTFADSDGDESDGEGSASDGSVTDPEGDGGPATGRGGPATGTDVPADVPADDLVCPWCLAPATAFVERGLTGLACGRCSAVLPTGAGWFRERDVVARRPMYAVEE